MTLSEAALKYNRLVLAVIVGLMLFGAFSYYQLPAQEDPKITIREAVVITNFPGMSADKIELLITKTIEEAVRTIPEIEDINSVSMSGQSIIHAKAKEKIPGEMLDQIWDDLRKEISDVRGALPEGTAPYIINDDFGDVAVLTIALLSDESFDWGERQDMAQHIADMLFTVEGTKRIDLLGVQEERIFIEIINAKLAQLNISPNELIAQLQSQNIIRPGGIIDADGKSFIIKPSGNFETVEDIRSALIAIPGREQTIMLGDITSVTRGIADPPTRTAYYNGREAIIFAISKDDEADVLKFTPKIEEMVETLNHTIPAGYKLENITRQADVVETAVYGVSLSVLQTIVVVAIVVIMFLGLRTGLIVGSLVPAVVLITLSIMNFTGIPLERMSLATLIIALGLLVDDGILIAEDFKTRIENGENRDEAIRNTSGTLAIPSVIASLTTILVFLPLMLAQHGAGEYTRSISLIILISLITSWAVSLSLTALLCHRFVKKEKPKDKNAISRKISELFERMNPVYEGWLRSAMQIRLIFIVVMIGLFFFGGFLMSFVPVKFFPDSDRPQVIIYMDMPAGTSLRKTDATLREIFERINDRERFPHIKKYAAYGGFGGPRFVLSLTPIDPESSKAFFMIDVGERKHADRTIEALREMFAQEFPHVRGQVTKMFLGPSDAKVLEIQIKGPDQNYIYDTALKIEEKLAAIDGTFDIHNDWENRVTEIRVEVNQQNARRAGVSSDDIARSLQTYFSGRQISEFREGDDIFPIIMRAQEAERYDLGRLESVNVYASSQNTNVPLAQVADLVYETNFVRIARENLFRTVTVEATNHKLSAEDMVPKINSALDELKAELPSGYTIEFDGVVKESAEGQEALNANLPLCILLMVFLVLAQFGSYRATAIVFLTIPLIIIGASVGLLVMGAEFGFMVILGLYALAGIIINNAVILIDRIGIERKELFQDQEGHNESEEMTNQKNYEAVISASVRRLRPILMSTTTTIIGLMPLILTRDTLFYGQASTLVFGLAVGTVLTLGFVPILYTYFFGIKPVKKEKRNPKAEGAQAT